jgi:glycogen operon protein
MLPVRAILRDTRPEAYCIRYRDDVRRFVRGDAGLAGAIASRIAGSADLYQSRRHLPVNSVNFVDCHDGFTLNDLVSFNGKHNDANGEDNRDGTDDNLSWNSGVEGPTDDAETGALRERRKRNFLATLLLSQGVPMLCGGDEIGRTQRGNNNAYCQDNELSWPDWKLDRERGDLLAFTRSLIALRRRHPIFRRRQFFHGRPVLGSALKDLTWLRPDGREMTDADWQNPHTRCLGLRMAGDALEEVNRRGEPILDDTFLVLLNGYQEPVSFVLPAHRRGVLWETVVDTRAADGRIRRRALRGGRSYPLEARSVAVLAMRRPGAFDR